MFTVLHLDGVARTYSEQGKRLFPPLMGGDEMEVTVFLRPEPPMVDNCVRLNKEHNDRRRLLQMDLVIEKEARERETA